jgi:hypothetical protein
MDISKVKMRLHIARHIINKHLKDDSHICGHCGVVNCTISIINISGFGINTIYEAESDCIYFYIFSMKVSEKFLKSWQYEVPNYNMFILIVFFRLVIFFALENYICEYRTVDQKFFKKKRSSSFNSMF